MVAAVRRAIQHVADSALFGRFIRLLESGEKDHDNLLRVLTYHRVDRPASQTDLYPGMISASPNEFAKQMAYVATNYHVVSMWDVLDRYLKKRPLPPRSVLITFDDAYRDFATNAWPILRMHQLPVTLFVPTAFPGEPERCFWWDRMYRAICSNRALQSCETPWGPASLTSDVERLALFRRLKEHVKSLPHVEAMSLVDSLCFDQNVKQECKTNQVLNWDELRCLAGKGVTLAPHSRTHPLMNRIPPRQVIDETLGSLNDMQSRIEGTIPPVLAYPAGGVNKATVVALRGSGIELAFTTRRGVNDLTTADPLRLRRINIGRRTTLNLLRAQLVPQARLLNHCWAN
jgi:peptidoglycan/xylan/chitin deacetylase (PgdA/CDA1 family)